MITSATVDYSKAQNMAWGKGWPAAVHHRFKAEQGNAEGPHRELISDELQQGEGQTNTKLCNTTLITKFNGQQSITPFLKFALLQLFRSSKEDMQMHMPQ